MLKNLVHIRLDDYFFIRVYLECRRLTKCLNHSTVRREQNWKMMKKYKQPKMKFECFAHSTTCIEHYLYEKWFNFFNQRCLHMFEKLLGYWPFCSRKYIFMRIYCLLNIFLLDKFFFFEMKSMKMNWETFHFCSVLLLQKNLLRNSFE